MNILVFGDSFSCRSDLGYLKKISDHFNVNIKNFSKPGAGLDYTWGELEKHVGYNKTSPDFVIITITKEDRPYHPYYIMNASGVYDFLGQTEPPEDLINANFMYHAHILTDQGSAIKKSMFESALKYLIMSNQRTKFIILPCFSPLYLDIDIKNYAIIDQYLMNYHVVDELEKSKIYINHLTNEDNDILGTAIIDLIENFNLCINNRFYVNFSNI